MTLPKKQKLSIPIRQYTLCFSVFVFFCVIIFFLLDKDSLFDTADGLWQQYTYFVSSGNVVRSFFTKLFHDHVFEYPMWDMTIGMGSDANVTYNPFAFPLLCIISALVPVKYSEYVFDLIVIFRLYLSGLAFIAFANEKGYRNMNAVAGAMVYVFSSTSFVVFRQMNFSLVFIIFPLILLGAEKVWNGKKSLLYFAVIVYSTVASFYFTYMMIILLVIYCVIRFLCETNRKLKRFFALFGKFSFLTIVSVATGVGLILPVLINLSKLSRLSNKYEMAIIDPETLKKFFSYCFTCISPGGDAFFGVSSFVVVAVICLFVSKKKAAALKWCSALCLVSLAFPFVGSVFNGFNIPTFRYVFALIFCFSFIVTMSFDQIHLFKGKVWYLSIGAAVLYGIICIVFIDPYAVVSAFSLLFSVIFAGIVNLFVRLSKKIREIFYMSIIFISCILIGYTCITICLGPMLDRGTLYEYLYVDGGMSSRVSVNDSRYRTDTINADFARNIMNSSMAAGVSGYDFYHSNQNQSVEDYYASLAVLGNPMGFSHTGFRGRCYAEILNACNYLVRSDEDITCIRAPYSYEYISTNTDYSLYKAGRGVSLVYFYDDVMSYNSYMEMNPVTRETNLMYYMVLDGIASDVEAVTDYVPVTFEYGDFQNVMTDGNNVIVSGEIGYISLKPSEIENGQISVYLSGLSSSTATDIYRNAVVLMDADGNPISADYSAQYPTTSGYYAGHDDIVFSFESIDEKVDSIRLYFFSEGEYVLDDIYIYSRPYSKMEQTLDAFYEHADMNNISYDYSGNKLTISTVCTSDKYLYVAIPYSEGWKAKVDGTPVEVIRANIAFMAVPVSEGSHTIEMSYTTPNLFAGWFMAAAGIIVYAGYSVFEKKKLTAKPN